jgi:rsbT antagonist protein RsbS
LSETGHIAVHEFEGSLIGVIQLELSDDVIRRFREDLLTEIRRSGARHAVVDVSGLEVMDLHEFEQLRRVFRMATIMGCRPILAGLNPGIAAALVQMDAEVDGLETALSVEHAIQALRRARAEDEGAGLGAQAGGGTAGTGAEPEPEADPRV